MVYGKCVRIDDDDSKRYVYAFMRVRFNGLVNISIDWHAFVEAYRATSVLEPVYQINHTRFAPSNYCV